ncbi:MAG: imidazole glycerol phosphate synthase subunit HisH [Deltaproteobacteria bacterium]|jgi:glutamine amidotransferase|nr:imidazole glycerol phosphate synthase subunit HisH [Deltaproteobacteria bacterium]
MTEKFLAILDYQAGNQTSVHRALRHLKIPALVTADPAHLRDAIGFIFPGVGAAGQAMEVLKKSGLDLTIKDLIASGKPFLGICLGCQIMLDFSEENTTETLGIFQGRCVRFDPNLLDELGTPIRIPHMGWNRVQLTRPTPLWEGISDTDQFYFVHSYYPAPLIELTLGTTFHGQKFSSFFGKDGVWAVQFHPEKSGPPGLKLLSNFYAFAKGSPHAQ